jgi:CRISPR-associated endonuclease Cas1/group II intron reverse transcriptase/maturase
MTVPRRSSKPREATLFPRLASPGFLAEAWRTVLAHYRQDQLPDALAEFERRRGARLGALAARLQEQTFFPQPAALIYIPKPNHPGERRPIALLEPEDRIVLTALASLLNPILDRQLLPGCFAYRRGRSANAAIETVHQWIRGGYVHAASGDIDDFFAHLSRARLLQLLRRHIWETPVVNLLEAYLHIGVARDLEWSDTGKGIAQGSPLSPALSNLYLAELDRLLETSNLPWIRYADNLLVMAREPEPLRQVWDSAVAHLASPCELRFNPESVSFTTAGDGFEFLGFWFKGLARTMSPARLTQKRTALTTLFRSEPGDLGKLVEELSEIMRGWRNYYGAVPDTRPQLELLEKHLEDLLIPWLRAYRSRAGSGSAPSAAELKARLSDLELATILDRRRKIKWAELIVSRSKPAPAAATAAEATLPAAAARAIRQRKAELAERRQLLEEILVTRPGTYLGRTGERLLIRRDGKREAEVPFSLVRNITFLTTAFSLSGEFMVEMAARGIPILLAGTDGRPAVRIGPPEMPAHELSIAQSTLAASPAGLELARSIVTGKIRNQVNLLQYFLKYPERRSGGDFLGVASAAVSAMESVAADVSSREFGEDHELERNRLFASEARAAIEYWGAVQAMLWWKPGFDKRVHRGAADLVNSLLNYGYGILYSRLWVVLARSGLNVNIGFLHKPQPGKAGLLYDFIEEFRAAAVDRTVFSLLNLAADLKVNEHGLDSDTRHLLARKVLERLQAKVRYHGESLPLQKVMELQAQLLVRHIENKDRYRCFVLPW